MFKLAAQENITVRFSANQFIILGSELSTLKLLAQYRRCDRARQGYSPDLSSFYFVLDCPSFDGSFEVLI